MHRAIEEILSVVARHEYGTLYVNSLFLQDLERLCAELFGHHAEHACVGANQMNADFIKVNMMELFLQDVVNEFGYTACTFHTNRSGADKDKGQQSLALFRVCLSRSFLKDT